MAFVRAAGRGALAVFSSAFVLASSFLRRAASALAAASADSASAAFAADASAAEKLLVAASEKLRALADAHRLKLDAARPFPERHLRTEASSPETEYAYATRGTRGIKSDGLDAARTELLATIAAETIDSDDSDAAYQRLTTPFDSDGVPISRVVSTLRPEMIPPTDAPGSPAYARTPVAASEGPSAAPKTQKPRRWEFGEIRALGEFCAVSVSARAIAVAELAGASLLAWFPTGDAAPPDAAGVSAGVASFAVPEASFSRAAREKDGAGNDGAEGPRVAAAFFLAAPERGGGVWCLEAPSDARALTCAVADAAETGPGG